ncbi:MAG: 5-formyltetrahydrofolate cyclo-ligase [Rhodobacteraceae bacterium]|nr:5-formyltetrahydrofolate cyclo-ligase [Paracoccaceae bacterium]
MTKLAEQKQLARKAGFARRKLAHQANGAGIAAAAHLMQWGKSRPFSIVAGYMPIRTEIDVLHAMRILHLRGVSLCVPVIIGPGQPLKFRQWTPDCPMETGPFGASVPVSGDWLLPDLVLCPLVAFDDHGHRLGYGGGFYDRSLAEIRGQKPVTALGYAYAAQHTASLPNEPTDQPLDGMVTENGVQIFR